MQIHSGKYTVEWWTEAPASSIHWYVNFRSGKNHTLPSQRSLTCTFKIDKPKIIQMIQNWGRLWFASIGHMNRRVLIGFSTLHTGPFMEIDKGQAGHIWAAGYKLTLTLMLMLLLPLPFPLLLYFFATAPSPTIPFPNPNHWNLNYFWALMWVQPNVVGNLIQTLNSPSFSSMSVSYFIVYLQILERSFHFNTTGVRHAPN